MELLRERGDNGASLVEVCEALGGVSASTARRTLGMLRRDGKVVVDQVLPAVGRGAQNRYRAADR